MTHRVGVEGVGERAGASRLVVRRHRVHHLRRHQHRHGGPLGLVALQVGVEPVVDEIAEQLAQLLDVLDAVRALPLHRGPVGGRHVGPAREPGPVRFDELDPPVGVGLAGLQTDTGLDGQASLPWVGRVGGASVVCPGAPLTDYEKVIRPAHASAEDLRYVVICREKPPPCRCPRERSDRPAPRPGRRCGAAAGGHPPRRPPRAVARRGAGPGGAAQPRRGIVPPARAQARGRRRNGARGGARHRGHPRQDAEPGDRFRRHARGRRRGGRAAVAARPRDRRPGHHPGLAHADTAGDRGRAVAGWDGRGEQVPCDGYAMLVRPVDRGGDPGRPACRAQPVGDGRLRGACAHRPGRLRLRAAPSSQSSAPPASPVR